MAIKDKSVTPENLLDTDVPAVRKPAPEVIVESEPHLERAAILKKFDTENPTYVHMYSHPDVSDWELRSKRQELVYVKGGVAHHKGDPVVRVLRSVWDKERLAESRRSEEQLAQVVESENLTATRNPKKPTSGLDKVKKPEETIKE